MHNAFSLTLILRGATFLYNIHFSYLSTAAGLLPFLAAFVLIKGTLSFIRLCFVSFFAGLVTTRVERASSGLWSLCTQVDNVSNLTCEDWREESCESFVMASRLSRQYLRQKKYESELLCCVFLLFCFEWHVLSHGCSKNLHFQNETKWNEPFLWKWVCTRTKTHFHMNGFALRLALKPTFWATAKWPVHCEISNQCGETSDINIIVQLSLIQNISKLLVG